MTQPVEVDPRSTSLDVALWLYQQDPPVLVKDKAGQAGNQPTRYADLAQANDKILTRLNALGVTYSCEPALERLGEDWRFVVRWKLVHVPSGEARTGMWPIVLNDNPQRMGSALSYARRYVLINLVNAATEDEDDDGQAAGGRTARRGTTRGTPARSRRDKVAYPDAEPPAPEAPRERVKPTGPTQPMQQKLIMQFKELARLEPELAAIGDNRDERLHYVSRHFGREVTTIKDLSFEEGLNLIDHLDQEIAFRSDPETEEGPAAE